MVIRFSVFNFSFSIESTKQTSRKFLKNSSFSWLSSSDFSLLCSNLVALFTQSVSYVHASQLVTEEQFSGLLVSNGELSQPDILNLHSYNNGLVQVFQVLDQADRLTLSYV